jgi:addiction module RelE/StbE family toxin
LNIRYARTALRDLDDIFSYIHQRNPIAAGAVIDRIQRMITVIGRMPFIGHPTDEDGVRMIAVVRYPFLIFYTVDESAEEIMIVRVRHAARLRL